MQASAYLRLMRINKPIGSLLLLWPTLTSLWMAAEGIPNLDLIIIFILGTFVMRSAGCVINDYADRNIDGKVERTKERPLATGAISARAALILFGVLSACGGTLLLFLNELSQVLALCALLVVIVYPFSKRWTHLPQAILGIAFSWGILMAWTATTGSFSITPWILFATSFVWIVAYDTLYAMVDKEDDTQIGVKSSAILFGEQTHLIVGVLHLITIIGFFSLGLYLGYSGPYFLGVAGCAILFFYQHKLIYRKNRDDYFRAFLNNNWVGLSLFTGTVFEITPWTVL